MEPARDEPAESQPSAGSLALDLTPGERCFAAEYFAGEQAGNATRAYLAVHPGSSYNTASVEASVLLKQPNIRGYLEELHANATALCAQKMIPWVDLLPLAQTVIVATAQGKLRNRISFEAAVYLVNRVMGTPTNVSSQDILVRDERRITEAIKSYARRVTERHRGNGQEVMSREVK